MATLLAQSDRYRAVHRQTPSGEVVELEAVGKDALGEVCWRGIGTLCLDVPDLGDRIPEFALAWLLRELAAAKSK